MNKIQSVSFYNQKIVLITHNSNPYVAMKPIAENIGLDWHAQRQRINRHDILGLSAVMITSVAQDGKKRDLLCLPLSMLNGWLFGIETSRVKLELREKLRKYQLECFDVLYNHFMPVIRKTGFYFDQKITGQNISALCSHMYYLADWWSEYEPAIRLLNPDLAGLIHSHFDDGYLSGALVASQLGIKLPNDGYLTRHRRRICSYA